MTHALFYGKARFNYYQEISRKSRQPLTKILADHKNKITRWCKQVRISKPQDEFFLAIGRRLMSHINE